LCRDIVVIGTVTANGYNIANGGSDTILNGTLNNVSSVSSGGNYRLGYINVTAGTWIINSQLSVYTSGANGTYIHASNCLSLDDGTINRDYMPSIGSQVPYGNQSQTTMYYKH
jgi:hypothetical protein